MLRVYVASPLEFSPEWKTCRDKIQRRLAQVEAPAFLRGVVQGLMNLEEGREVNLADVKKRLGLS